MPPDQENVTEQPEAVTVVAQEDETSSPPETGGRPAADGDQGETPKEPKDSYDRDRAERTIKAIRHEKRQLEQDLAKARKDLKTREDAELSESQRIQRELEAARDDLKQAQQQLTERDDRDRQRNFQLSVTAAAEKAGALRPSVLYRLVDQADVPLGDDGAPVHPDKVVAKLRETVPMLFKDNAGAGNADAGSGRNAGDPQVTVDSWLRRATGRTPG